MKLKHMYLVLGIILSVASKWMQFQYGSLWGDILILPAAVFFVLTIFLYIPQYLVFLKNKEHRGSAMRLAVFTCASVVSFQLFTMVTFGRGNLWGVFFLLGVFLFAGLSWSTWRALVKQV